MWLEAHRVDDCKSHPSPSCAGLGLVKSMGWCFVIRMFSSKIDLMFDSTDPTQLLLLEHTPADGDACVAADVMQWGEMGMGRR